MAARRNTYGRTYRQYGDNAYDSDDTYLGIDGNNVRKLQPAYNPEEEAEETPERKRTPKRHVKKHPLEGIDFFAFSALLTATVVTMCVCFDYLKVQSDITTMQKQIAALESTIIDTQKANRAAEEELEASVDLSYVYDVATKELGMIQPDKDHIKTYKDSKSDMARQYQDVPDVSKK